MIRQHKSFLHKNRNPTQLVSVQININESETYDSDASIRAVSSSSSTQKSVFVSDMSELHQNIELAKAELGRRVQVEGLPFAYFAELVNTLEILQVRQR